MSALSHNSVCCFLKYSYKVMIILTITLYVHVFVQDEAALVTHRYEKYRALGTYSLLEDENERKAVIEVL